MLALEPNTSLVKGKFLRNVLSSAAPAAITDIVVLFLTMLFTHIFKIPAAETSTVAATLVALVGFMMLFRVCRPFDAIRRVLFIGMLLLFAVGIFFLLCSVLNVAAQQRKPARTRRSYAHSVPRFLLCFARF